ncbi:hypothetical protein M407DRAFT_246545 [Tulasnella calospora MUT 4182]|uniref:Thioredoxin domain-containing protein n=1 Tax=Tulasnella calospora MUT 4182 TaxID=1051891 RepID=A0A0C3K9T6_9AGAM|nr:hypothetical protein M407DRAFT_246545 [Tulasnella calospora MUT 4182]
MAYVLSRIARRAHHTVANLTKAQIQPGTKLPNVALKDLQGNPTVRLAETTGKNIIVGVPGAFTPVCNDQVPGYIANFDKFKAKGINDIYVVAVNDVFVIKAWKEKLAAADTSVKFISDDHGEFVSELGLAFDATAGLGGVRAKRFSLVTDSGKVTKVNVEEVPSKVTVTAAEEVLKSL